MESKGMVGCVGMDGGPSTTSMEVEGPVGSQRDTPSLMYHVSFLSLRKRKCASGSPTFT